jgi:diadenosine tetraphosphate (Ap4A) HIT family hydrolase
MVNATMRKFGYPGTLVKELDHWVILLRPAQVTLGSLILAAKSECTAYSDLSDGAFAEQAVAVRLVEKALRAFCQYERINYLMLMMVDPNVHFHILPRYSGGREWQDIQFEDHGWPGPPQLKLVVELSPTQITALLNQVKRHF